MDKSYERGADQLDSMWQEYNNMAIEPMQEEWPQASPLPESLPPVMPFNELLLPDSLRDWVMDIAYRMQCPPDFPAVGAIVALSSLIGARAVVQPKELDDWKVVPNLWGLIIGRPGVMKSPALAEVLKPLNLLQGEEHECWEQARANWEIDKKLAEMQAASNEKKAKSYVSKDPQQARKLLEPADLPTEPIARRFIVNDTSVEKLGEILQANPWGVLAYRDELYGLLSDMDKSGQEGARTFYLQAYDGDKDLTVDRISRGTVRIPRVCVAMVGGIQPGRIQDYVRHAVAGGRGDDGLLQRFGMSVWPNVDGKFTHVDQCPDKAAKERAYAVFERLVALKTENEKPQLWRFDSAAQSLFVEWRIAFETQLKGGELHPALESHFSKYRKLIPALALIFALIDTPDSGQTINAVQLHRAIAWSEYLQTHASRLYSAAMLPEMSGAQSLLKKVRNGSLGAEFTPRQVAQKGWSGLPTPEAVTKAADLLAEYGWLRREIRKTGGRPSGLYVVNPTALH